MGKGATSSGSGKSNNRNADQARAAWMEKHPGQFPDSVRKEPNIVRRFSGVAVTDRRNSKWEWGMLGGVLAFKAGLSKMNPVEGLS